MSTTEWCWMWRKKLDRSLLRDEDYMAALSELCRLYWEIGKHE